MKEMMYWQTLILVLNKLPMSSLPRVLMWKSEVLYEEWPRWILEEKSQLNLP